MKTKLYGAYGSNMNIEQMKYRCPDARIVGTSMIDGYELVFRGRSERGGVATIEPKDDCNVPIVVWEISKSDEKNLDIYEGFPRLYIKKNFNVRKFGDVMVYVMNDGYSYSLPCASYYDTILEGYRDNNIPRDALNEGVLRTCDYLHYEYSDMC